MGTISCCSNHSSYPTGIKNTIYVAANVLIVYAKFQLHTPYEFCEEEFLIFFENLPFMLPKQPIKLNNLDKSHMKHGGIIIKHICEEKKFKYLQ